MSEKVSPYGRPQNGRLSREELAKPGYLPSVDAREPSYVTGPANLVKATLSPGGLEARFFMAHEEPTIVSLLNPAAGVRLLSHRKHDSREIAGALDEDNVAREDRESLLEYQREHLE